MNHATTLRHSRAHRAAVERNAEALDAKYVTRVTIEGSERDCYDLVRFGFPAGVTLVSQHASDYGCSGRLVVECQNRSAFSFHSRAPFKVVKTERVRK